MTNFEASNSEYISNFSGVSLCAKCRMTYIGKECLACHNKKPTTANEMISKAIRGMEGTGMVKISKKDYISPEKPSNLETKLPELYPDDLNGF